MVKTFHSSSDNHRLQALRYSFVDDAGEENAGLGVRRCVLVWVELLLMLHGGP